MLITLGCIFYSWSMQDGGHFFKVSSMYRWWFVCLCGMWVPLSLLLSSLHGNSCWYVCCYAQPLDSLANPSVYRSIFVWWLFPKFGVAVSCVWWSRDTGVSLVSLPLVLSISIFSILRLLLLVVVDPCPLGLADQLLLRVYEELYPFCISHSIALLYAQSIPCNNQWIALDTPYH